jgi:hypothetical protein
MGCKAGSLDGEDCEFVVIIKCTVLPSPTFSSVISKGKKMSYQHNCKRRQDRFQGFEYKDSETKKCESKLKFSTRILQLEAQKNMWNDCPS